MKALTDFARNRRNKKQKNKKEGTLLQPELNYGVFLSCNL